MHTTTPLQERILDQIRRQGPLTFADYMRMALYEPNYGYYVNGKTRVGWEGDFFTSSDVSEMFAHCMGRQLFQMWEMLRQPRRFNVVEQGSGRALVSQGVQAWAEQEQPAFAEALHYTNVDIGSGADALAPDPELALASCSQMNW
ncbi:SAM-dependent methyltransferase [Ktedonospora formicarum]|uniref:SAM-dependent methyltransferase n=1 Tax=Ktedonospora formicarum TaxID=2778364 RepID=A0A8J3HZT6_9CHLR|nr:SAM-dependent methyltransferase [Ktedonospora formicarum]GHO43657.1 hypothetical protein KSX_18200 [Ktedonospora formicarum]